MYYKVSQANLPRVYIYVMNSLVTEDNYTHNTNTIESNHLKLFTCTYSRNKHEILKQLNIKLKSVLHLVITDCGLECNL